MSELKVIENNLVPVYETSCGEKVVYGSELHEVLEVKSNCREWIKRRFTDIDATENEDYTTVEIPTVVGGAPRKDHIIKLDTAKEMAMLERNDKGKQVRKYFIAVEKKYNRMKVPMTPLEQLQLQANAILQVNEKVDTLDKKLDRLEADLPILGIEIDKITCAVKKKGVECLGGKDSEAYADRSLRGKVYSDIYAELKRQFGVTTFKAIKRSQCGDAVEIIGQYKLPYILATQIQVENAQVNLWGGARV